MSAHNFSRDDFTIGCNSNRYSDNTTQLQCPRHFRVARSYLFHHFAVEFRLFLPYAEASQQKRREKNSPYGKLGSESHTGECKMQPAVST